MSENDKKFTAKWTSSDEASTIFGGWSSVAKKKFNQLFQEITAARATDECSSVEQRGMEDLRQLMGITVTTEAEWKRTKKRKSTETLLSQVESIEFVEEV